LVILEKPPLYSRRLWPESRLIVTSLSAVMQERGAKSIEKYQRIYPILPSTKNNRKEYNQITQSEDELALVIHRENTCFGFIFL
jgi:hypothetical protein